MDLVGSHPFMLGTAAFVVTPLVLWLLSQEQARCSICGILQGRTLFSKYFRLLIRKNWACVKCRRNFGWWGKERVPVRVGPR
jgi:hypothetical protein